MEDEDEMGESSAKEASLTAAQNDKIADLNSEVDELKRELEAVKKKLRKSEFERDSAQRGVENLKTEVKELSKKFQEEKRKTAKGRSKSNDPLQANGRLQGTCYTEIMFANKRVSPIF